jgi:hypothetical protein
MPSMESNFALSDLRMMERARVLIGIVCVCSIPHTHPRRIPIPLGAYFDIAFVIEEKGEIMISNMLLLSITRSH